jgi:hypothetical protein
MDTKTRTSFGTIWRPVFAGREPTEAEVAHAWGRTRRLFADEYGAGLTPRQAEVLLEEMAIAWLLRALSPVATAEDAERATLAQQAALWLGVLSYDLDRVYDGYYRLLQA